MVRSWAPRYAPKARGKPHRRLFEEADRATAEDWSVRMEGYGGPAQPSPRSRKPLRRIGLARGGVQSLQDPGEPTAGRNPAATRYADLETRSIVDVQVVQEAATRRQCG